MIYPIYEKMQENKFPGEMGGGGGCIIFFTP